MNHSILIDRHEGRVGASTTEHVMVSNVAGAVLTVSPALVASFTSGKAVTTYNKRASALFFDESADEFAVGYTTAVPSDTAIGIALGQYADLHCASLKVDAELSSSSFKTVAVTVPANAAQGGAVPIDVTLPTRGSYILVAESVAANGACAVFSISKSQSSLAGAATAVMSSSPASAGNDEGLRVTWSAAGVPALYHHPLRTAAPTTPLAYSCRLLRV